MALSLNFNWRGAVLTGAYVRIDEVRGGMRMTRPGPQQDATGLWQGTVCVYASTAAASLHPPVVVMDVTIPYDAIRAPLPLLYTALKLRPEFAGAVDS